MKSHFLYLILSISTTICAFAQGNGELAKEKGIRLNQEGKYSDAIEEFSEYITQNPIPSAEVYRHRGYSFYYLDQFEEAISDFKKAREIAPGQTDASFALAKIYYKKKEYQLSLDYFNDEIEYHPQNAKAFNDRGMVKCQIRDYDSAFDDFNYAFKIDSSFAMAYNNAGAAKYYNQDIDNPIKKDIELAKKYFTKAIDLDPTLGIAYRNRGAMNMFLKHYEEALYDLKIAGKLQPNNPVIPFYRGIVLSKMKKPMQAITELEKAIDIDQSFHYAYEEIGDINLSKEYYDDAKEYYQKAIHHTSDNNGIYKGLMYYKMAIVHASDNNKTRMYNHLETSKKLDAFKDKKVYQKFLSEKAFRKYRSEKKFRKFTKSVTKLKKEQKFLNSELRWFRMDD